MGKVKRSNRNKLELHVKSNIPLGEQIAAAIEVTKASRKKQKVEEIQSREVGLIYCKLYYNLTICIS